MDEIQVIQKPITKKKLKEIAKEGFVYLVKAVVDIEKEIMAIGGELHADEEVFLMENFNSKREYTWGINLYVDKTRAEMIEYDSMINLKPYHNNRSRSVEDKNIQKKIVEIINKLILE